MSRDLPDSILDILEDDVVYPFYAIEMFFDNDQTLRLWTGVGVMTIDNVDYYGTGNLLSISDIEETSEMAARGATLTLSGVPQEVLSLAMTEAYQGRLCKIYFGQITKSAAPKPDLYIDFTGFALENGLAEIFTGYMDTMDIMDNGETSTVEVTVENKLIDLERQRVARYTSAYQKSIYPNDLGFDFVESLQDKPIYWGRKAG